MSSHDYVPDPPLAEDEAKLASQLTAQQLASIDSALLTFASKHRRKVSFLAGAPLVAFKDLGLPDVFFALRVRELVAAGKLEAFGDLACMRYSEVRIPGALRAP